MDILSWHAVFGEEFRKIIFNNPVMAAGKSEGRKLSVSYPSQYCCITYTAAFGDKSNGDILRAPLF